MPLSFRALLDCAYCCELMVRLVLVHMTYFVKGLSVVKETTTLSESSTRSTK